MLKHHAMMIYGGVEV